MSEPSLEAEGNQAGRSLGSELTRKKFREQQRENLHRNATSSSVSLYLSASRKPPTWEASGKSKKAKERHYETFMALGNSPRYCYPQYWK